MTVDPDDALLERLGRELSPDFIQLHARETPTRVAEIGQRFSRGLIKVLPIAEAAELAAASGLFRHRRSLDVRRQGASRRRSAKRPGCALRPVPAYRSRLRSAVVPFTYGMDGEIYAVGEPCEQLREPSMAIPAEVTTITGIDDAMVQGRVIDPAAVTAFAAPAALVVAHNAAFDRRFLKRFCETFNTKPWACSMSEVDWAAEGYEGSKLAYLASGAGFFCERHRATHDCMAAIELLVRRLIDSPMSGQVVAGRRPGGQPPVARRERGMVEPELCLGEPVRLAPGTRRGDLRLRPEVLPRMTIGSETLQLATSALPHCFPARSNASDRLQMRCC